LDLGANHPFYFSNTALFYAEGGRGVLVEPDPFFVRLLRRMRRRDRVIQGGVHFSGEDSAEFFILDSPTLNTFSRAEMERYVSLGHHLKKTLEVGLLDINSILAEVGDLDFVNLDIEGLDLAVLKMIDFERFRPVCICAETITYEKKQEPKKQHVITELMRERGYMLYADTFINSIYVDRSRWVQFMNSNG
jgi:FkbM family methyltransferase